MYNYNLIVKTYQALLGRNECHSMTSYFINGMMKALHRADNFFHDYLCHSSTIIRIDKLISYAHVVTVYSWITFLSFNC